VNVFPEDPRSISYHSTSKEHIVRQTIDENFQDLNWIHDKLLWTQNCDCSHRCRLDYQVVIGNTILVVETDDFAHTGYDNDDE